MKFVFFNDTGREVNIHPATQLHGCVCDMSRVKPLKIREFNLPEGTYPMVKMWDYGDKVGLSILVTPIVEDSK